MVLHCPLHAAAGDMEAVLQEVASEVQTYQAKLGEQGCEPWFDCSHVLAVINKVLAAARPK